MGENINGRLCLSPDGKLLAYPYQEFGAKEGLKLAVISVSGGPVIKSFRVSGRAARGNGWGVRLRWSPDGKSLDYLLTQNSVTDIWEQPLTGEEPRQVTKFNSGEILDFDWSPDHKLLITRGSVASDVVFISNYR